MCANWPSKLGSIAQSAPIYYRGIKVGQVLGVSLSDMDGSVSVRIFIRAPHDRLVREGFEDGKLLTPEQVHNKVWNYVRRIVLK